jgi:hypothetical protein
MNETATDPRRIEVWIAMAEHFLDTETRQDIPLTALRCVEAQLTPGSAQLIWQYEVSPVVGANLLSVAGEWAGWDRDWLVERIERVRRSWCYRSGTGRYLRYRLGVHFNHGVCVSIIRCMQQLLSVPSSDQRQQMARDLAILTSHYFDFCPRDLTKLDSPQLERLRQLRAGSFLDLMRPALVPFEAGKAARQLDAALAQEPSA